MTAALALVGLGLIALPRIRHAALRRLPPAEAARTGIALLAGGLIALWVALVLAATPTVLRGLRASGMAGICEHAFGGLVLSSPALGWSAGLVATWIAGVVLVCSARARRARHRTHVEPWLGVHEDRGEFEVVVLPTATTLAISVPAPRPQVVISAGLWDSLDAEERETVIAHEAAHLRLAHHRYLVVLNVVERVLGRLPFVASALVDVRSQLEEWADEATLRSRPASRRALVSAITRVTTAPPGQPAFRASHSSRIQRLERLVFPLGRISRTLLYLPAMVLAISAVLLVMGWFTTSHHAIALGAYCPD
ncbi:MAG: M56 family metallopeptidase [Acidimicrobiia bacterium]|nr:M56 family metallopeptidase [Acidimicrobiia bacterium]